MTDTHEDPLFGRLIWDEQLDCWLGGVDLTPDFYVEITIAGTDADRFAGFEVARESLSWFRSHELEARRQVAAEMAELYNHAWTDEDEPVSVEEFAGRIGLNRVSFEEDGSLLLSYDDGPMSMFCGHLMDAQFGPDKAYLNATLIG